MEDGEEMERKERESEKERDGEGVKIDQLWAVQIFGKQRALG